MRGVDAELVAEPGDVSDPHPPAIVEVDDFRGLSEAQHVGRQHSIPVGERGYRLLPADFGADTEFAAVQQDHRVAVAGLQVAGDQAVDDEIFALNLHGILTRRPGRVRIARTSTTATPTDPVDW